MLTNKTEKMNNNNKVTTQYFLFGHDICQELINGKDFAELYKEIKEGEFTAPFDIFEFNPKKTKGSELMMAFDRFVTWSLLNKEEYELLNSL